VEGAAYLPTPPALRTASACGACKSIEATVGAPHMWVTRCEEMAANTAGEGPRAVNTEGGLPRRPAVGDALQTAVEWEDRGKKKLCWAACLVTKVRKDGQFYIQVPRTILRSAPYA